MSSTSRLVSWKIFQKKFEIVYENISNNSVADEKTDYNTNITEIDIKISNTWSLKWKTWHNSKVREINNETINITV